MDASVKDERRHKMPVILQAKGGAEERQHEDASTTERILLSQFMVAASNQAGRPIVVLGERIELSSPPAAQLLEIGDKALLWERASGLVRDHRSASEMFILSDGREVTARFVRIDVDDRPVGVLIELDPRRASAPRVPASSAPHHHMAPQRGVETATAPPVFLGRSAASQYLREQAAWLGEQLLPVLITGEPGTGKLTLAKAIAGDSADRVLLDAARTTIHGEGPLLRQLATVADSPGKTIILRRINCLSDEAIQALIAIAHGAEANRSRLIVTATVPAEGKRGLIESVGLRITVPPLRERSDDLVDLIPFLIQRRGATARMMPRAIQTLTRCDWPGNVRELDGLVRALLTRKRTTDIVLADLPPVYQCVGRRLRRIEHVERAAIVQALLESNGNRTKAAELLEIGRATLYRKIHAYGLELEVSTS